MKPASASDYVNNHRHSRCFNTRMSRFTYRAYVSVSLICRSDAVTTAARKMQINAHSAILRAPSTQRIADTWLPLFAGWSPGIVAIRSLRIRGSLANRRAECWMFFRRCRAAPIFKRFRAIVNARRRVSQWRRNASIKTLPRASFPRIRSQMETAAHVGVKAAFFALTAGMEFLTFRSGMRMCLRACVRFGISFWHAGNFLQSGDSPRCTHVSLSLSLSPARACTNPPADTRQVAWFLDDARFSCISSCKTCDYQFFYRARHMCLQDDD